MKIKKAVIPAAGLGTRFLPWSKSMPKEMLPIVDKPVIQYVIEEAVNSGIDDIIIITGRGKRSIEDHFDKSFEVENTLKINHKFEILKKLEEIRNLADIHYIRQKEPLGLGHAILCAKKHIGNEPFAVLLGDDIFDSNVPCIKQLINTFEKYNCSVLGLEKVQKEVIPSKGIADVKLIEGNVYLVNNIVEKPSFENAPSDFAWMGRAVLTPEIFAILEKTEPGVGGEIQITDAIKKLLELQKVYGLEVQGKGLTLETNWII